MPQSTPEVTLDSNGLGDEDANIFGESQSHDEVTDVSQEPEPRKLPFDAMRNEPILTNVLVENYDGETDERGFLHGIGTAYFQGDNVYTGEFVNGLMHGKGKYIWSDKTVYEGDFLENQLCGDGVYIWPDGSVYEGEVRDGLRHGEGTFKCSSIPCTYSGMWSSGKREGQGSLKYDDDGVSYYEGSWCENLRHGYGARRYASGNVYEGEWKNNVRHGQGTMHWYNTNQRYCGEWLNGVQHGFGEHTWFLRRIKGSQYPLRNQYVGELVNGLRHGRGIFYYANGARYDGEWVNNMKHGNGMFVFKNGMVFKGLFDSDHMLEFPDINPSGMITPDITSAGLPVRASSRIAAPSSILSGDWTTGLELSLAHLFDDRDIDLDQREAEMQQVNYVLLQHISKLKEIYTLYSAIGNDTSIDNTSAMTKMQFCRFLKDCQVHHYDISLPEILRLIAKDQKNQPYDPWVNILMRDFLTALVTIAYHIFADEPCPGNQLLLPWCVSKLVMQNVLHHPCSVGGVIYPKASTTLELTQYFQKIYAIFQYWTQPRKTAPHDHSLNMRQFLWMLQEYKLINQELSAQEVISVLACDDPRVIQDDTFINLEIEISFLEFLEGLVSCAMVYVKDGILGESPSPKQSLLGSSYSHSGRSHVSTVTMRAVDSPDVDSRVSSHSVFISSYDKQDGEQSPAGDVQVGSPIKQVEIPVLIVQASSTDEPKPILIEEPGIGEGDKEQEVNQLTDEQQGQDEVPRQTSGTDANLTEGREIANESTVLEDDFGLKMSYFFNKKFFPAADKQEMLKKITKANT